MGAHRGEFTAAERGIAYITHLFSDRKMFLRRDWLDQILAVTRLQLRHLEFFRLATVDLVPSKMMRGSDRRTWRMPSS